MNRSPNVLETPPQARRSVGLWHGVVAMMHALVHLVEDHHGPAFWQALGRAMPDWQKRKDALADKAKDYLVFGLGPGRAGSRLGAAGEQ